MTKGELLQYIQHLPDETELVYKFGEAEQDDVALTITGVEIRRVRFNRASHDNKLVVALVRGMMVRLYPKRGI